MTVPQPVFRLDGKVAIITGASRGIGVTVARAFLEAGCAVMLAAKDPARLQRVKDELGKTGTPVSARVCDVTVQAQVEALVRETIAQFGTIDVLVNNAAVLGPIGPAWENAPEAWQDTIKVNLVGPFLCSWAVLPTMIKRCRGKIINMAGRGAAGPWPRFSAYATSKTALVRLTETLAVETKPYNIQVNIIAPGANETDMFRQAAQVEPQMLKDLPEDSLKPARLALFLASERSNHITGRFIHVNQNWMDWTVSDVAGDRYTLRRVEVSS
jgi:3-oxoacyl-[acyl-carrier protein] reductase